MCAQADARTRTKVNRTRGDEMIPTNPMRCDARHQCMYTRVYIYKFLCIRVRTLCPRRRSADFWVNNSRPCIGEHRNFSLAELVRARSLPRVIFIAF